tara:strand:- start:1283 stop:1717 length:435 start_codon:yes stop_codon:yes gene_type:complete
MFANFDYSLYKKHSIIKVMLYNEINQEYFNNFIEEWNMLYNSKKNFIFIFNTINIGLMPLSYSIQMSQFISKLKKEPKQYLQKSIIIVNRNIVKYMLNLIFTYQSPVAPVFLIELNHNTNDNIIKILNNQQNLINKKHLTTILP